MHLVDRHSLIAQIDGEFVQILGRARLPADMVQARLLALYQHHAMMLEFAPSAQINLTVPSIRLDQTDDVAPEFKGFF
jgi:hypothetical protein